MENRKKNDSMDTENEITTSLESIRLIDGDLITLVVRESQMGDRNIRKFKETKVKKNCKDLRICKENMGIENINKINEYKKSKHLERTMPNKKYKVSFGDKDSDGIFGSKENRNINTANNIRFKNEGRENEFQNRDIRESIKNIAEVEIEILDEDEKETISTDASFVSYDSFDSSLIENCQQNVNARRERLSSEFKEAPYIKESTIHCTYQGKWNFVLTFKATNVRMTFLRQEKRKISADPCDKICQPESKYFYQSYIDCFSSKYMLMRKDHVLMLDSKSLWKSKSKTAIFKKNLYEPEKEKNIKTGISKPVIADTRGFLYLYFNGITFLINPNDVTLESFKPVSEEEIILGKQTGDNIYNVKSRGTFLGKRKNDLLLFKFDIENINFEQSWHKTSTATQSKDYNTYIKYFSIVCNKTTHCAIPLSTYKYIDPMIKIKYKNKKAMFDGIMPSWKKEEKKKRLNKFCKLNINTGSRIVELNYGSFIQFQTDGNLLCKAKTGVHDTQIVEGDLIYETMIMEFQKQESFVKRREKEMNLLVDSKHTSIEVLDCDIISNSL